MSPDATVLLSYYFNERANMLNKKTFKFLTFGLVSAVILAACAAGTTATPAAPAARETAKELKPNWQVEWDRLLVEARKEGTVLFYTISGAGVKEVGKAFKDRFGVEVDIVAASAPEIGSRLVTEYKAGFFLADVINTGGGTHHTLLKPNGIVQTLAPALLLPEVVDPKAWRIGRVPFVDEDRTFLSMIGVLEPMILYNTDLVKKAEFSSLQDLLKPQWKEKLVMVDPTALGTTLAATVFLARLWGMDKAKDYLTKLSGLEPIMTRDPRQGVEWVARAKYPVSFAAQPLGVSEFLGLGAPIEYADITEGALMETTTGGLAMPAKPAHPNTSKLFINWLLTKEGQTAWVKTVKMPGTRLDVSTEGVPPVLIAKQGAKFIGENEEHFLTMGKMREINREIFAKQLK